MHHYPLSRCQFPFLLLIAAGPVEMWESRSGPPLRLFQAAAGIMKKMAPKASFSDFRGCVISAGLPVFSFLVEIRGIPPRKSRARMVYRR